MRPEWLILTQLLTTRGPEQLRAAHFVAIFFVWVPIVFAARKPFWMSLGLGFVTRKGIMI